MKIFNKICGTGFNVIDDIISLFYPNRCAGCREIIDNNHYLCPACEMDIERINSAKRCLNCGLDKTNCDCKKYIYYFDGAISLYKNDGVAQNVMYAYKLGRKLAHVSFFAKDMAQAVKNELGDIKFDAIVAVPTTIKSQIKYGFSPVDELCFALEELLEVKFLRKVIKCRRTKKAQHKMGFTERIENAREKFYCGVKIEAKTVLLVDDIKTTGATLSECARKLKFAGADNVYCVTALAGIIEDKKY